MVAVDVSPKWRPSATELLFDGGYGEGVDGHSVDLGSWHTALYAGRLLDFGFRPPLAVPTSPSRAQSLVDSWQEAEANFDRQVAERAQVFGRARADEVAHHVKELWRQASREAGLNPGTSAPGASL